MSNFKVNLADLSANVKEFSRLYKLYSDDQDLFYKNLRFVDGSWNDNNTMSFLGIVEDNVRDSMVMNGIVLGNCQVISDFVNDISQLLSKISSEQVKTLAYNSDSCSSVVSKLNEGRSRIASCVISIQDKLIKCEAEKDIKEVVSSLESIKNRIGYVESSISSISTGIENGIVNYKKRISDLGTIDISDNKLKYNWDTFSLLNQNVEVTELSDGYESKAEELDISDFNSHYNGLDEIDASSIGDQEEIKVLYNGEKSGVLREERREVHSIGSDFNYSSTEGIDYITKGNGNVSASINYQGKDVSKYDEKKLDGIKVDEYASNLSNDIKVEPLKEMERNVGVGSTLNISDIEHDVYREGTKESIDVEFNYEKSKPDDYSDSSTDVNF